MKLYGTIEKIEPQEDGTLIVTGYASSEDVDSQGEIVTAKAMKDALPDYMTFANIREMHQAKAAGTALEAAVQDDGRTWLKALIVDKGAIKKVQKQVYKGFSIGGKITGRDEENPSIITGIQLSEISLVDRPANGKAVFAVWKADMSSDFRKLEDQLHKLSRENEALKQRVDELESRPVPPKAAIKAFGKEQDNPDSQHEEEATDALSIIRKIHQSGGKRIPF